MYATLHPSWNIALMLGVRVPRRAYRIRDKFHDVFADLGDRFRIHVVYGSTINMEFFMAGVMLLMGLWLLLPIDTFATRGGYEVMEGVGRQAVNLTRLQGFLKPESIWGFFLLGNAFAWGYGISRDSETWRRSSAMAAVVLWTFIAACFVISDFRFWSTVVYPYYAILCIWLYIRACR